MELQYEDIYIAFQRIFCYSVFMEPLFSYREPGLYCHHSLDAVPDPALFSIHAHEMPEVYCFLSGKGQFLVEGSHYLLSPGDILLMRPAETHKLLIEPDEPYRRIAVHFSPDFFDTIDSARRLLHPFYAHALGQHNHYPASRFPALSSVFSNLVLTPGLERFAILSRLLQLLTDISAIYPEISGESQPVGGFPSELVAYVNAHLYEELSLSMIAHRFAHSVSQISRTFREATGTSLWEYVMMKRLLSARAMLQRGETAQKSAEACGFSDYSAFYRAYQKRFGHAPSDDRP